jgi:ABC-type sugar transport system substrate-binding protein
MSNTLALFLVNDTNDFQVAVRDEVKATALAFDLDVEVLVAQGDPIAQIRQIYACIRRPAAERPRALLVIPVRDATMEQMVRDAIAAGMGCIVLNRHPAYMEALRKEFPTMPLATVGSDQTEAGRVQAQQARALLPGGGLTLYVMGPSLSSATQDRQAGFTDEIKGSGIDVAQVHGDWSTALAEKAVLGWLRLVLQSELRLRLVVCQNDAMALGARQALDVAATEMGRAELGRVPVTGFDGHPHFGRKLVDEGRLTATIIHQCPGAPAVKWLGQALQRGQFTAGRIVLPVTPYPETTRLRPTPLG